MSVSKGQLIADVAAAQNLSKSTVATVVEGLLTAISNHTEGGEKVIIQGFGTFQEKTRAARTGRNPATGLPVEIPAKSTLSFKPAKTKG